MISYDLFEDLINTRHENDLICATSAICTALGFERWYFCLIAMPPFASPYTYVIGNFSRDWLGCYISEGKPNRDLALRRALSATLPHAWASQNLGPGPHPWDEGPSTVATHGISQSTRQRGGMEGALILLRSSPAITPPELVTSGMHVNWLAQILHAMTAHQLPAGIATDDLRGLTLREIDVLRWTAAGRTSSEVAGILNIAETTVNFHLRSASTKLGTSNRTSTAVRAAVNGALYG